MLGKKGLMRIKASALRRRVWFKTLTRVERAILDLTIRCVEKVRSPTLARTISTILSKIWRTLEEGFMTKAETVGRKIAEKLSVFAQRWGNKTFSTRKLDRDFIKFLGVNALNMPIGSQTP